MNEHRTESPSSVAPRLLDRLRAAIRIRNYSERTAQAYAFWVRRFILFHGKRHPEAMGAAEVKAFLTYLALTRKVAASTQNQALGGLLFLYRFVLGRELDAADEFVRAKRHYRIPVVLSPREIAAIAGRLQGWAYLATVLMYGSGLRLLECLRLRVQDIDFERGAIVVRQGKGQKDRLTLLPDRAVPLLRAHLAQFQHQHTREVMAGGGLAFVQESVLRRFPGAASDWAWQWVFPAPRLHRPSGGAPYRRHLHKSALQRAFAKAVRESGVLKEATCHTLRHSFATHLVEAGYNIRTIQELMGHKDLATTMIYTRGRYRGQSGLRSPFDALPPIP